MLLSIERAKKSRSGQTFKLLSVLALVALVSAGTAMAQSAAERESASGESNVIPVHTEVDISGRYNANIGGENFPATLDIWGTAATLKVSMDGQDKPMEGMFVRDVLKVMSRYGAENFNLTTAVQANFDGVNFQGLYRRADTKLGQVQAPILLTPIDHGGGGGDWVKMQLPRRMPDIPGNYGMVLKKEDGTEINTYAQIENDGMTIKIKAGGREYSCDYSGKEIAPVYWQGTRMDTFKLTPTESGFRGTLTKETGGKEETFEAVMVKQDDGGAGGHDERYTYVYDVIINNGPPVLIGKLRLVNEDATLTIKMPDRKLTMEGSLVEGILSARVKYGTGTRSIRAQQNPNGLMGVFRKGSGTMIQDFPIILKHRPQRGLSAGPSW